MHIAAALGIAVVATLLLALVAGVTPFVGIPIAVVVVGIAALWAGVAGRESSRRLESDVPSTREAAYDPVVDPAERR
jgi:hypothetical protein